MVLHAEQLDDFATGIAYSEIIDSAWRPHRLPRALGKVYEQPQRFAVRRDCPSGVRLRFVTDASSIRMFIRVRESAESCFAGTVRLDGTTDQLFSFRKDQGDQEITLLKFADARVRQIDVLLPHLCQIDIHEVDFGGAEKLTHPSRRPCRWLAMGDSITQGFVASSPSLTYVERCAATLDAEVHNLAVGGSILHPELAINLPAGEFNLCTIAYGVCDFQESVSPDVLARRASQFIKALFDGNPRISVVVLTPLTTQRESQRNTLGLTLADYRHAIRGTMQDHPQAQIVEGPTLMAESPDLFADWVHPNDTGSEKMAENLLPHLRRVLNDKPEAKR
jgi:lysophospholipase L1-like esterase